ncbi:MAG: cobyrinic acid a,c-diamide synthase [Frankiales bacterium]|nr:cobyrinic acid a,c-diamide synthase [Frankiales bacterium]
MVIAAPSSGAGKTTVATGLMAAYRQRGLQVSPHKVGPDYIDPGYHALATGRPGRNLDPVMVGEQLVAPLFLHGARGADLAVVEGVMGLFDGRGSTGEGSTAHVAHLLGAPVVLVVDASSQSTSVAALVHGFQSYDPTLDVAGVILNRVATDRHEGMLRDALEGRAEVLGVLRRDVQVETPSRHLGLVPAAERTPAAVAAVDRLGELVAAGVDLDRLQQIAATAADLDAQPWAPPVVERTHRPIVAVAGGRAFTFAYAEFSEALTAAGGEVVVVDPLRDSALPEGTGALVLPGGFPEVYTEQIMANSGFLASVREHLARQRPTYAECAGLLLLCKSLDGVEMVGHFDATAAMTSRLTLGYRTATSASDSLVGPAGTVVVGHEFHRTTVEPRAGQRPAWHLSDGTTEGFTSGTDLLASYVHVHPAAVPQLALNLVARAAS